MGTKTHKRLCKAKSARTGKPCKKSPINGGVVCDRHGGRAPQVKAKAEERIREYVERMVDPDRLLREAARVAYSDITELYNEDGSFKDLKDWPKEMRAAIGTLETVRRNIDHADGKTDTVLKVKSWDKLKALEMLFKHKGLLEDKLEHSGEIQIRWQD